MLLYTFVLVALNFKGGEHERGRVYALSFLRALAKVFQHLETLKLCKTMWCYHDNFYAVRSLQRSHP